MPHVIGTSLLAVWLWNKYYFTLLLLYFRLYLTNEISLSFHTLLLLGHEFDVDPVHVLLVQNSGELHGKHDLKLSVIF